MTLSPTFAPIEMVSSGVGRSMGLAFLRVVLDVVGFRTAMFGMRRDGYRSLILDIGAPAILRGRGSQGTKPFEQMFDQPLYVPDANAIPVMAQDPVIRALSARAVLSVPVATGHPKDELFLVAADARPAPQGGGSLLAKMIRLSDLAADSCYLLESLNCCLAGMRSRRQGSNAPAKADAADPSADGAMETPRRDPECPGVVTRFLTRTLIRRPGLHHRGDVAYTTLTRWRAAIKDSQIEALKALKIAPPDALVDAMAAEIVMEARQLGADIAMVTGVACGHSGEGCLSERLGRAVARQSGWPHVALFEPTVRQGSSHPRRNAARPPLKLIGAPRGTVLVVDDVATSGQHLADAAHAIRTAGATSVQIAYIKG